MSGPSNGVNVTIPIMSGQVWGVTHSLGPGQQGNNHNYNQTGHGTSYSLHGEKYTLGCLVSGDN